MTIRLSTGLRNAMAGQRATVQNVVIGAGTMALVDGGASNDTITGAGFGDFSVHDNITIAGCTTEANDGTYEILSVAAGVIGIAAGSITTPQVLLTTTTLASSRGGSIIDLFRHGYLQVYTGSQPASADTAASGNLVNTYSLGAATFTKGADDYGLNFDEVAAGVVTKDTSETWQGECGTSQVVGWFRFMSNAGDPAGETTAEIRFDGSVATSGADLNMPTTQTSGTTYTIDTFTVTIPAA